MKKSLLLFAAVLFVLAGTLISCSTISSMIGLDGLAGFDGQSEKALQQGFDEIDWLEGQELYDAIAAICEEGRLTVAYSDRYRALEFTGLTSPLRVYVTNNSVEILHEYNYAWNDKDGWWNPRELRFECYGEAVTDKILSDEIETINESFYNEALRETVYTRAEKVDHWLTQDAKDFIYKNWTNNDLYIQVIGRRSDYHKVQNVTVANVYRLLFDTLYPYTSFAAAEPQEIIDTINGMKTFSVDQALAMIMHLGDNENLTAVDVDTISNLINSKVK